MSNLSYVIDTKRNVIYIIDSTYAENHDEEANALITSILTSNTESGNGFVINVVNSSQSLPTRCLAIHNDDVPHKIYLEVICYDKHDMMNLISQKLCNLKQETF